jgi:hypothetical protein
VAENFRRRPHQRGRLAGRWVPAVVGATYRSILCQRVLTILVAATWVITFEGCSRKTESFEEARAPRASSKGKGVPSDWLFHPLVKAETTDEVAWGSELVEVDLAGSRWLRSEGKAAEVSAFGAPEPLSAVLRQGEKLSAVGQSGAVYVAEGPLSPFVEVRTPPTRFVTTVRTGSTLLSISQDGAMHRSDNVGKQWHLVSDEHFFVDLAVSGEGTLLAYSVPEQWHRSTDQGRSLTVVELPTQAPRRIGRALSGEIFVEGLYQTSMYRADRLEALGKEDLGNIFRPTKDPHYELPSFPRASDVVSQRGVLLGAEYVGLRSSSAGVWKLQRGSLSNKLEETEVEGLKGCGSYLFVASGERSDVLCYDSSSADVSPRVRIYRSPRLGEDYKSLPTAFRGQPSEIALALSSAGELAILGLCPLPEKGCTSSGVTLLSDDGKTKRVHVPGVPSPSALSYDSGGNLWLSGRRNKDGHVLAYRVSPGGQPGLILDATREAGFPQIVADESKFILALSPSGEGLLALTLQLGGRGHVATLNNQGELISFGTTPSLVGALHGSGRWHAALAPEDGALWESTTGGLSWVRHRLPREVCTLTQQKCSPALACSSAGCLVGEELVRIGWGHDNAEDTPRLPRDVHAGGPKARLSGFECDAAAEEWTNLDGIVSVPRAADVALGDAAWAQSLQHPQKAALTAISVGFGAKEIHRENLLLPVADASDHAFFVIPQIEGVAAVRYRMPSRSAASTWNAGSRFSVEVAWDNRVAGVYGAATLDHPAVSRIMDPFFGSALLQSGQPGLVSVAGEGLYVRLGPRSEKAPTYFVTGRGKNAAVEELGEIVWPAQSTQVGGWLSDPLQRATARHEHVRVAGKHEALMMFAGSRVIAIAEGLQATGHVRNFRPYLLGLLGSDLFDRAQEVNIAYRGDKVGFVSYQLDLSAWKNRASFVELGPNSAVSAPMPAPLQQDVGQEFTPCSAELRRETPRIVAPLTRGAARTVTVVGAESEPLELTTEGAVLFGTKEEPCVAAWEGQDEKKQALLGHHYSVLVFPAEGAWSWLFRTTRDAGGNQLTAARPIQCRAEGAAKD